MLASYVIHQRNKSNQIQNLKFELDFNVKKLESWIEEIGRFRNAVNGDNLSAYSGYFDLSQAIVVTAGNMLQSGLLYKSMHQDDFSKLLVVFQDLSIAGEQNLNNQISLSKQAFAWCMEDPTTRSWVPTYKGPIVANIDSWENKFKQHKLDLGQIRRNLK